MTTAQEGYSAKYQKAKSNKLRSVSPNHYEHEDKSPRQHQLHNTGQSQLGKVISQLSDRVDGIQIKIVNITNIMKLFQKYTQTKDIQYQKQKENDEFRKNIGEKAMSPTNIQALQTQTKINQLQSLIHRTKAQITAMQGLRVSIQRQNSKKTFSSPQPFETIPKTLQSPTINTNTNTKQVMQEIEDIMDKMQINLRQQINKKIDICMSFVKNATQTYHQNNSSRNSSPSAVNAIMMQEQLHNMTLTVNKVQSDCSKNKMIVESKIQQIVNYINSLRKKDERQSSQSHSHSRSAPRRTINNAQQDYSQNSSISKRSKKSKNKSKSKNKTDRVIIQSSKTLQQSRLQQQKKQKQSQLREALKKKKQNQQKLKMRK